MTTRAEFDQRERQYGFYPGWGDCVEVDAVPANVLRELARQAIEAHIDREVYAQAMRAEELERQTLDDVMHNLGLA